VDWNHDTHTISFAEPVDELSEFRMFADVEYSVGETGYAKMDLSFARYSELATLKMCVDDSIFTEARKVDAAKEIWRVANLGALFKCEWIGDSFVMTFTYKDLTVDEVLSIQNPFADKSSDMNPISFRDWALSNALQNMAVTALIKS
jgi:hypothetical protein